MTQYSGKVIRKTPVTPTQASASGVWKPNEVAVAVRNNTWPVAGVPDPISRSVRLRASASATLSRVPGVSGNLNKWTISFWVKRGLVDSTQCSLVGCQADGNNFFYVRFEGGTQFNSRMRIAGTDYQTTWNPLLRDPSAWYHFVYVYDRQNATTADKQILYVNGVRQTTSSAANPATDSTSWNVSGVTHYFGYAPTNAVYFDGYLTEFNYIDGQALTPSSFGTTDAFTGAWVPMAYTGTYGTNGFYLNFKDNTSTTTLGYDYSGNSNNWTANNISLTAGTTYDSMLDVPTPWIGYNTDGGVSVTRGNYCTWNPISTTATLADANLKYSSGTKFAVGSIFPTTGKFYAEIVASGAFSTYGIAWGFSSGNANFPSTATPGVAAVNGTWFVYSGGGLLGTWIDNASGSNYSNPFTSGQTWQLAVDVDNGYAWLGQNNTWYSSTFTATGNPSTGANPTFTISSVSTRNGLTVLCGNNTAGGTFILNFGQQPFTYTPPTGFKALCTTNLPEPTIKLGAQYMAASTYTGTGAVQSITNGGNNTTATTFQPDFVWLKSRSGAGENHELFDAVRGVNKALYSNLTNAEGTDPGVTAFNSNGYSLAATPTGNTNGVTYIGWQWKAAGSSVSNTSGTITSTVNAGTTQGFSVLTATTPSSYTNYTAGHGLGTTPAMIIYKELSGTANWWVWHKSFATPSNALQLNTTAALQSGTYFGTQTSTVASFASGMQTGLSVGFVAYCFAEVAGYSKFGSYTGNGSSDGTFVYLGFRPRYVLIKWSDGVQSWNITDTSRQNYNLNDLRLLANSSNAEEVRGSTDGIDMLSNGFKIRSTATILNSSGGTYIFAAFAENPFKYSNAR